VRQITESLFSVSNPNMKSDLITARALAGAAITGALANVEINLASLKDQEFAAEVRKRVDAVKS
jgi:formiminotetrahydrofolate cyclodeaminase